MIFVIFLLISLLLDSNLFSVPLVFVASLLLIRKSFIGNEKAKKKAADRGGHKTFWINSLAPLILSVVSLFMIDVIRLERLGTSPLIFLASVVILIIYGKFFELSRSRFFAILLAIVTCVYAYLTGYDLFSTLVFLLILIITKWILAMISHEKN